jgi:transcriptional regulator with XRE-family HTH domain
MQKIFEFTLSQFDYDLINHIKTLRNSRGLSQENLSVKMGLAKSFVGNVENIKEKHKYSTRHIALLANAFGFKTISELLEFPTPKYDIIKVTVKQTFNESGSKVISNEVLKIEEL